MPSRNFKLDSLDWKFLLRRSGFLLLGALATILLTVFVPAFEQLDAAWSPLIVMGLTALAELINRFVRDNTRLLIVIAILAQTSLAIATPPVLVITPGGYFYLEVGNDGVPVSTPVDRIVDLRGGDNPPPVDPPPPPVDAALVRQIRDLAKAVADPAGSQALALVYTQSSGAVADGLIPVASSLDAVRVASDKALALVVTAKDWGSFRSEISTLAANRIQRGELTTPKQMADFLQAISSGLELSADGSQALDFSVVIGIATATNNALGLK